MIRSALWAPIAVLALMPSACGTSETMTQDEAAERAEQHIDDAVAVLPDSLELESSGGVTAVPCDDLANGGAEGPVSVGLGYWLRGLPVEDNEDNVELLYRYWIDSGYQVTVDRRPNELALFVQNEEDSFRMSVTSSIQGGLSISAGSPCVLPED